MLNKRTGLIFIALIVLNILIFFLSFAIGKFPISIFDIPSIFSGAIFGNTNIDPMYYTVIFDLRLPRILAAILIGISLSLAGLSLQSIFKNPLVSPYILGISSGSAFGLAFGIILGAGFFLTKLFGFVFGLLSVVFTLIISRSIKNKTDISIVLTGIVIGSLFGAFTSFIKYIADPYSRLPSIVFFLMGTMSYITLKEILLTLPLFLVGILGISFFGWKLNIISLGKEEAVNLGVDTERVQFIVIVLSTLITSLSVALCGIIGWVGLVVPHIGRIMVGPDHRKLIPFCILFGGIFLLLIDNISKIIVVGELPIGILTSIIGAPVFILILAFSNRNSNG